MILQLVCYGCGQVLTIFEERFKQLLKQGLPCYAAFEKIDEETGHITPLALCDKRMLSGYTDYFSLLIQRYELAQLEF